MSGISVGPQGISITEGGETVSLTREEMSRCRHSLDVLQALEAKLGHSFRNYYYFKHYALDDRWECVVGGSGLDVKPKDVIKEVPVIEYVDRLVEKEVIKEVEVEKIVYEDKPVPYEKLVEVKVVEYVDRVEYVPYPEDRIVYRDRDVFVERVVEVPVENIVEVPVEPTVNALWQKWLKQLKET